MSGSKSLRWGCVAYIFFILVVNGMDVQVSVMVKSVFYHAAVRSII